MRCLPQSKISQIAGNALHDWHAEIVAIRAFNRWLLDSCRSLATAEAQQRGPNVEAGLDASIWLRQRSPEECIDSSPQPFAIRDDVEVFMYCSEAPCGDASMELVMAAQDDATPWAVPSQPKPSVESTASAETVAEPSSLRGRGFFSELGIVRRKPSRSDAPPTLSKSCTDKIAQTQFLSLLSCTTSLVVHPGNAYVKSLVIPSSQLVPESVERAFGPSGRMKPLQESTLSDWTGGYRPRWLSAIPTCLEFEASRRQMTSQPLIPSNLTAIYTPHFQETLIGGVLQGRKQFDPRGASKICRRGLLATVIEVALIVGALEVADLLKSSRYRDIKENGRLAPRRALKSEVRKVLAPDGWSRNVGDDEWSVHETD